MRRRWWNLEVIVVDTYPIRNHIVYGGWILYTGKDSSRHKHTSGWSENLKHGTMAKFSAKFRC